jgi:hypothetical protein
MASPSRPDVIDGQAPSLAYPNRANPRQVMVTSVGLRIPAGLDFGAWEQVGLKIVRISESSSWCLGDWLVYGQYKYTDRYRQVIAAANLDYQTLRNYAWVARRFDLDRRREELSFQHHAEVAALGVEDQDRWLDMAESQRWSRNELRRNVRAARSRGSEQQLDPAVALPRLNVPAEHVARWREAAEQVNRDFEEWIVMALNERATQALMVTTELGPLLSAPGLSRRRDDSG